MKPWGESDAKQRDQVVLRNGDTFGKKATQRFEAALQVSVHEILLAEKFCSRSKSVPFSRNESVDRH